MHFFVTLASLAAVAKAVYVEPYQSSAEDYPSEKYETVAVYGKRGDKYATPYASSPTPYTTPAPSYPEKSEPEYYWSSSSSSMPPPSFIDNTGVGDLDDNLDKLPVKRGYKAKTYGSPAAYSSPAPTPYSKKAYEEKPEYGWSFSSSSSSMPPPSFIDNTGVGDLDDNLDNLPVKREYKQVYGSGSPYTWSEEPHHARRTEGAEARKHSPTSGSASASPTAPGGLSGLTGVLGDLPI